MKKKGLIISTVVMVVVLIASLTTATYAWFTTASSTTISGFNLEVKASTAVNIGLKRSSVYDAAATVDSFDSGSCTYTGTAGQLGGTWTGELQTMSPTIEHNINWGSVTKAVGASSAASIENATIENTKNIKDQAPGLMVAANLGDQGGKDFGEKTAAVANGSAETQGDYAYLFLGVSPSKAIATGTNKVYIVIQASGNGSTVGLAAAMHVAYRLNGGEGYVKDTTEGKWVDKDVFGEVHQKDPRANSKAEIPYDATVLTSLDGVTNASYANQKTTINNAALVEIDLTGTNVGDIDQLELIIYLAGADSDCVDAAKGVTVKVGIFFSAQAAQA